MPELNAAFLANNLWLLVATILVIFMNAGFAMVEAGMCRQKNAVNILAKSGLRSGGDGLLVLLCPDVRRSCRRWVALFQSAVL